MREILFKAKSLYDGKWVFGDLLQYQDGSCVIHWYNHGMRVSNDVDPQTVCQYTGLKDKNGKKIFENDIIKLRTGRICAVFYNCNTAIMGFDIIPVGGFDFPVPEFSIYMDLEYIGNLYDKKGM